MTAGTVGKLLLGVGALLVLTGLALVAVERIGLGRVPGDVVWRRGNLTVYAPFGLMILLSIVLTIVLNLFFRR